MGRLPSPSTSAHVAAKPRNPRQENEINNSDRVKATGVPVELQPDLTIRLRYNLLSAIALEHKYGTSNALAVLVSMTNRNATDVLAFLVGASMLHEGAASVDVPRLSPDMDALDEDRTTPEAEAAKLGRRAARLYEGGSVDPLLRALVEAIDIGRPIAKCARCDHHLSDHDWMAPCQVEGCACEAWTLRCERCNHFHANHDRDGVCQVEDCKCRPKAQAGKAAAPEDSTGAGSGGRRRSSSTARTASSGG